MLVTILTNSGKRSVVDEDRTTVWEQSPRGTAVDEQTRHLRGEFSRLRAPVADVTGSPTRGISKTTPSDITNLGKTLSEKTNKKEKIEVGHKPEVRGRHHQGKKYR
jgi:hypothetical protein